MEPPKPKTAVEPAKPNTAVVPFKTNEGDKAGASGKPWYFCAPVMHKRILHSGAFNDVEDEFAKEEDELEASPPIKVSKEDFCRCRSKCLRKPYCKCKALSTPCKEACHPSNRKCLNK